MERILIQAQERQLCRIVKKLSGLEEGLQILPLMILQQKKAGNIIYIMIRLVLETQGRPALRKIRMGNIGRQTWAGVSITLILLADMHDQLTYVTRLILMI